VEQLAAFETENRTGGFPMKLRSVLALLVVAAATASVAVAAPPQGKGRPTDMGAQPTSGPMAKGQPQRTGDGCRPRVSLILKGVLADAPGAGGESLSVKVASANHHGGLLVKAAQPVKILVGPATMIRRQGKKTLADLVAGDRVLVQVRACKAGLTQPAAADASLPQLVATRIVAHPGTTSASTSGTNGGTSS